MEQAFGKSNDQMIFMLGKLTERGGGRGLMICASYPAARVRMTYLCDRLEAHAIPFTCHVQDMRVTIDCLDVSVHFMAVQDMAHRVQGMELAEIVDEASRARKLTENEWYGLQVARSRVRDRH